MPINPNTYCRKRLSSKDVCEQMVATHNLIASYPGISTWEYNGFPYAPDDKVVLQGDAVRLWNAIRLTAHTPDQLGAVWREHRQFIGSGFDTTFYFKLRPRDEGDPYPLGGGIAFIVQDDAQEPVLGEGGNMGYGWPGIPNCIAVEFDTFWNDPWTFPGFNDMWGAPHISVQSRGALPNRANHDYTLGNVYCETLANNAIHSARIVYDPPPIGALYVYLNGSLRITADVGDLSSHLGLSRNAAYVGIAGVCGSGVKSAQWITYWGFEGRRSLPLPQYYAYRKNQKQALPQPPGLNSLARGGAFQGGAHIIPDHLKDVRNVIKTIAVYYINEVTGIPFNWRQHEPIANNLYWNAMKTGAYTDYGGTDPNALDWRNNLTPGQLPYDMDIGEIKECVSLLAASPPATFDI